MTIKIEIEIKAELRKDEDSRAIKEELEVKSEWEILHIPIKARTKYF